MQHNFIGDTNISGGVRPEISVPDDEIKADVAADVQMEPPPVVEEMVQAEGVKDVESGFGFSMPGLRVSSKIIPIGSMLYVHIAHILTCICSALVV